MGKGKVFGTCALCGRKQIDLMDSHIIPKAVYRRSKTYQNSIFRSFYEPKKIFRDGEKKPMLCHECEEFFSKYEHNFSNQFLDKYLKNHSMDTLEITAKINFYILTVAWRIIYDDLYVYHSFEGNSDKSIFEEYEYKLWKFLFEKYQEENPDAKVEGRISKELQLEGNCLGVLIAKIEAYKRNNLPEDMSEVKNYIYTLKELGYTEAVENLFSHMILGYSFNVSTRTKYYIISMYNGLVIATVYHRKKSILITDDKEMFRKASIFEDVIKEDLIEEINYQIEQMKSKYPDVQKELDESGLREKIAKRYNKK